jgi:hypothetical protein
LAKYPDIPEFYKGETRFGLRYCIATYWNMELAYEHIKSHEKMVATMPNVLNDHIMKYLQSGGI